MHHTSQNQKHAAEHEDFFLGPKYNTPITAMTPETFQYV